VGPEKLISEGSDREAARELCLRGLQNFKDVGAEGGMKAEDRKVSSERRLGVGRGEGGNAGFGRDGRFVWFRGGSFSVGGERKSHKKVALQEGIG